MIVAYPTRYAGIEFRSRLEAHWAAFFSELGWAWDYEPIDFGGWMPDFLVDVPVLGPLYVEVKPAESLDGLKVQASKVTTSTFRGRALVLGVGPLEDGCTLGLVADVSGPGIVAWRRARSARDLRPSWRASHDPTKWRPDARVDAGSIDVRTSSSLWQERARANRIRHGEAGVADAWADLVERVARDTDHPVYPGLLSGAHHVSFALNHAAAAYRQHSIQRTLLTAERQDKLAAAAERCGVRLSISILPDEMFEEGGPP
jgi:hypothetical protein